MVKYVIFFAMIIGEYTTKVGEKKRIAVPSKFRKELGSNLILTRGYEKALILVNKKMWDKVASEIVNGSFINRNIRETSRFLVGSASEVIPDSQGRIVVPKSLFEYADFQAEVIFIGLINWIEIWDSKQWEIKLTFLNKNGDKIAESLTNTSDGKK